MRTPKFNVLKGDRPHSKHAAVKAPLKPWKNDIQLLLEILLLLFQHPERSWSAESVARELRIAPISAGERLDELARASILSRKEDIGAITEMLDHAEDSPCVLFDDIPGYPAGRLRVLPRTNSARTPRGPSAPRSVTGTP